MGSYQFTGKKRYMTCCISQPADDLFAYSIVVLGLFKLNIKARHEIPEFLDAKPLIDKSYCIQHRLELKNFTSHKFCSILIEQLDDLEKVRTENLKISSAFAFSVFINFSQCMLSAAEHK